MLDAKLESGSGRKKRLLHKAIRERVTPALPVPGSCILS